MELGSGTRIQHPGDLEAGPVGTGGHSGQGEGPWDAGPGRKFCAGPWAVPRPARCPRSSSAGTRAHSFFSRSAGSRFRPPGIWVRACAWGAAPGRTNLNEAPSPRARPG